MIAPHKKSSSYNVPNYENHNTLSQTIHHGLSLAAGATFLITINMIDASTLFTSFVVDVNMILAQLSATLFNWRQTSQTKKRVDMVLLELATYHVSLLTAVIHFAVLTRTQRI